MSCQNILNTFNDKSMLQKLPTTLIIVFSLILVSTMGCRTRNASGSEGSSNSSWFDLTRGERKCKRAGWEKVSMSVSGINRSLLYKAPKGSWFKGVILVLHGGGGEASHFCAGGRLVKPQIEFANMAVARGFAVMALESTDNIVTDAKGLACGKRFDFSVLSRSNIDLPFIGRILDKTIPFRRPPGSSKAVFVTGLSTGGYMTIRAASYFDNRITAFAPISAGDPYGTDTICDTSLSKRKAAKGILVDRETRKQITNNDACLSSTYKNESKWQGSRSSNKPAFKQFQHESDGIVDFTCMLKATLMLTTHGYKDRGAYVIRSTGKKDLFKHLWLRPYNKPILDFFENESARAR